MAAGSGGGQCGPALAEGLGVVLCGRRVCRRLSRASAAASHDAFSDADSSPAVASRVASSSGFPALWISLCLGCPFGASCWLVPEAPPAQLAAGSSADVAVVADSAVSESVVVPLELIVRLLCGGTRAPLAAGDVGSRTDRLFARVVAALGQPVPVWLSIAVLLLTLAPHSRREQQLEISSDGVHLRYSSREEPVELVEALEQLAPQVLEHVSQPDALAVDHLRGVLCIACVLCLFVLFGSRSGRTRCSQLAGDADVFPLRGRVGEIRRSRSPHQSHSRGARCREFAHCKRSRSEHLEHHRRENELLQEELLLERQRRSRLEAERRVPLFCSV